MHRNFKPKPDRFQPKPAGKPVSRVVIVGALFFVAGGLGYRHVASGVDRDHVGRAALKRPMTSLSKNLTPWIGHDVSISDAVLSIAGYDDTVSRRYDDRRSGKSVWMFIGYTGRPHTMPRHRPMVCYPNTGYTHLGTMDVELKTGRHSVAASLHSFLKPGIPETRTLVLNFFVLDGAVVKDESSFWGALWRTPNLASRDSHYVAQVEISTIIDTDLSLDQRRLVGFAERLLPDVLQLLSNED